MNSKSIKEHVFKEYQGTGFREHQGTCIQRVSRNIDSESIKEQGFKEYQGTWIQRVSRNMDSESTQKH